MVMFVSVFVLSYLIVATLLDNVETEAFAVLLNLSLNLTASVYLIEGKLLGLVPLFPVRNFIPLLRMLKVFAPMLVKLSLMESLIESIAVKIPTKAVIPIAIIKIVKTVLSKLLLTDCKAIFIFSKISFMQQQYTNYQLGLLG